MIYDCRLVGGGLKMEEYQDHSLGRRVFQKIREDILNGIYKENDELRENSHRKRTGS